MEQRHRRRRPGPRVDVRAPAARPERAHGKDRKVGLHRGQLLELRVLREVRDAAARALDGTPSMINHASASSDQPPPPPAAAAAAAEHAEGRRAWTSRARVRAPLARGVQQVAEVRWYSSS